jgi:hypothetical protein
MNTTWPTTAAPHVGTRFSGVGRAVTTGLAENADAGPIITPLSLSFFIFLVSLFFYSLFFLIFEFKFEFKSLL